MTVELKANCFGRRQHDGAWCLSLSLDPDLIARQWLQGLAGDGAGVREGTASAFAVVEFVKGRLEIGWGEIGRSRSRRKER